MQRLGQALHLSSSRNLIIKVEYIPQIGEIVVDEELKPVGKVFDIFGPVSSPYAAINPTIREPEKLSNKTLYIIPSKRRKEKIKSERR
ncbi:MAG: Gar1/Naf1 family protein [Candidatus Jordarchaeaceae archaeon]